MRVQVLRRRSVCVFSLRFHDYANMLQVVGFRLCFLSSGVGSLKKLSAARNDDIIGVPH
jgi:hypothetical protein